MRVAVSRKERFCAAHRLYNNSWSEDRNFTVFDKCANPGYHGHNYEVVVTLKGSVDPETGYVFDMKKLGRLIKTEVVDKFDHKNLNLDTPYFKTTIPTAENIAVVIWTLLKPKLPNTLELKVRLYETEKNYADYPAD